MIDFGKGLIVFFFVMTGLAVGFGLSVGQISSGGSWWWLAAMPVGVFAGALIGGFIE